MASASDSHDAPGRARHSAGRDALARALAAARGVRRLEATRIAGVALLCVLGQFAIEMPEGYFGPADVTTLFGAVYSGAALLLGLLGAWGHATGWSRAGGFALLFYSANIGVFLPALESDPVRATALMTWMLLGVARQLFPLRGDDVVPDDPVDAWRRQWAPAATQLILVTLVATATIVGFQLSTRIPAQLVCLVLNVLCLALTTPFLLRLTRTRSRVVWATPAPLVLALALAAAGQLGAAFSALALAQLLTLGLVWAGEKVTDEVLHYFFEHPALLTCLTFAALILAGTLLLSFPAASATGARLAPVDALFTATSAACVTGLTVLDTPTAFSGFGQAVILGLFQVGGLNIMVLSTFAALALGRRLGLRGEHALGQVLDLTAHRTAYDVTRFIVISTFCLELVGAALLGLSFWGRGLSAAEAAWRGAFHSVSAFCNAGFALQPDSVVMFQGDPLPLIVMATLVIIGGLGFTVLATAWARARGARLQLSLHVKLVLAVSAALLVVGTVVYAVVEWNASLAGLAPGHKLVNAFFQSASLRTAGFNSVDLSKMERAMALACCALMLIGASPGGTGGGMKTTTFAVLVGTLLSVIRGGAPIVLFRRTIPVGLVYRSAAVFIATAALGLGALFVLLLTQRAPFEHLLFEVCSAVGTVGLSIGATAQLDGFGKLVVTALMFAGRVGPLTLVLLLGNPPQGRLGYPDAKLMIG